MTLLAAAKRKVIVMAKFLIKHREVIQKSFIIEAKTADDALDAFRDDVESGSIDLGDMEMIDSEDVVSFIPEFKTACEWK